MNIKMRFRVPEFTEMIPGDETAARVWDKVEADCFEVFEDIPFRYPDIADSETFGNSHDEIEFGVTDSQAFQYKGNLVLYHDNALAGEAMRELVTDYVMERHNGEKK